MNCNKHPHVRSRIILIGWKTQVFAAYIKIIPYRAKMWLKNTFSLGTCIANRNKAIPCVIILLCLCSYMAIIAPWRYATEGLKLTTGGTGILLFSYMRGGSTLVGDFYRNSPGIFYAFEPLIPFLPYHYFTNDSICRMRDIDCEVLQDTKGMHDAISTINNFYACKIRHIPRQAINEILKENKSSLAWSNFGKCLQNSENNVNCFDEIENACQRAEVKVLKVLRLSYIHMESFLKSNPSLHILFLVRDPRAILNSRIFTDWFPVSEEKPAEVKSNVDSLCKKMSHDIRLYEQADAKYKVRMQQLNIADVTRNEQEMMKLLYNYRHNYKMQNEDKTYLDAVSKRKSEKQLFRDWKQALKNEYKQYVEERCHDVILYLDKPNLTPEPMKLV